MGLFAVGDIHGCATAFEALLETIQLKPGDRLVTLGDYVNKGPDVKAVLDRLIKLYNQGVLIPLKGNHELKMIRAIELQQTHEAGKALIDSRTLQSYSPSNQSAGLSAILDDHVRFIRETCHNWYETESHIFVHATVDPDTPLYEQLSASLFWNKLRDPQPHQSGKTLVCGHTPQKDGRPLNLEHTICLDTAIAEGQWLTCLNIESGQVWQANPQGKVQTSWIQDYRSRANANVKLNLGLSAPMCLSV